MPDIPFGGPGRLYDDAPAPSDAFPAPAPIASEKPADEKPVTTGAAPAETPAPEEIH